MGKLWLGAGLLVALLVLGLWTTAFADNLHRPVSELLEQASQISLQDQWQKGVSMALEAKADWDKNWHVVASATDHAPMDEIDGLFAKMEIFVKTQNREAFAACCAQLSRLIHAVAEAHSPAWWNFL